jgi:DNA-binding transcriptional ArsR family regulator
MTDAADPTTGDAAFDDDAAWTEKAARALSSPLRMRVLRLCRFEARTNKELAQLLDVNPGTMLHHVRTLVEAGMLAAEAERVGERGAREIPYRSTGLSWHAPRVPNQSVVLIETMRQQLEGIDPEAVKVSWVGLRLNAAHRAELEGRIRDLLEDFAAREPDADGESSSLVIVMHPENNPPDTRE